MLAEYPREVVDEARPIATRDDRKVAGICTYRGGCEDPASDGSFMCRFHAAKHREYQARSAEKRREKWKREKLCLRCGATRIPGRKHCAKCLIDFGLHRNATKPRAEKHGENKQARIAANTSVDADGRSRYRGKGSRGQPKRSAVDRKDLQYAIDALYSAVDELVYSERVDGKAEKLAHAKAMTSFVHLAGRFCDDVLARHGEI